MSRTHPQTLVLWAARSAFAAALWYAAFRLPLRFPPSEYLRSPSYALGFNNSLAVMAIAFVLGVATLANLLPPWRRERGFLRYDGMAEHPDGMERDPQALPRRLFWILAIAYGLLTWAGHWYTTTASPADLTWEVRHFVHRMRLMEHYGLQPYSEFQSEYGPILAHAPTLVHRLLAPVGASDIGAYFICQLLLNLCGLGCLFYLASRAAGPPARRGAAFAVVGLAGFTPYLGLNGVVLRYALPMAAILFGHRLLDRPSSLGGPARTAATALLVAMSVALNASISPETGVAFTLGWIIYATLRARRDRRTIASSIPGIAAAGLAGWMIFPQEYYGSLLRFSAGANNLPLVPAAHIVFFLFTLALLVPRLAAFGIRGRTPDAPLLGSLAATAVVMMPGALGRADPPHVLLYGLGPSLLLMLGLATGPGRRPFRAYAAGYFLVSVALFELVNLVNFFGVPMRALVKSPIETTRDFIARQRSSLVPRDLSYLARLDRYAPLGAPFATYGGIHDVEEYLFRTRRLDPEYFVAAVGIYTEKDLERKIAEMGRFDHLVVPLGYERPPQGDRSVWLLRGLRRWYLYPVRLRYVRDDLDTDGEIARFIAARFEPVEEIGPALVMRRRARADPPRSGGPR